MNYLKGMIGLAIECRTGESEALKGQIETTLKQLAIPFSRKPRTAISKKATSLNFYLSGVTPSDSMETLLTSMVGQYQARIIHDGRSTTIASVMPDSVKKVVVADFVSYPQATA